MKTRAELNNIACMTSANVTGVSCTFELPSPGTPKPKIYLYKVPADLGRTLKQGDLVLAEYEGTQASNRDRPVVAVIVHEVHDSFDPEDMNMIHRWVFERLGLNRIDALRDWEQKTTDMLIQSQRRWAWDAALRETVGEAGERPAFPALPAASVPEEK